MEWLKARLAEGYRIGEAARLIGGNGVAVPSDSRALADEIVAASVAGEVDRVARSLDQAFELYAPERAISEVVEPALGRIGDLWRSGEARIVDEHWVSELMRGKLRSLLDAELAGPRGLAVHCCVPGERHECGLLAVAVLLHADGWGVVYLGADTPLEEAAVLADALGARVLCVSATMPERARSAESALARVAERHPNVTVVRGGAAFGGEPASRALKRLRRLAPA